MSKDIRFYPEVQCDNCDAVGAFDFMGDYLCEKCIDFQIDDVFEEVDYDDYDYLDDEYDLWDYAG